MTAAGVVEKKKPGEMSYEECVEEICHLLPQDDARLFLLNLRRKHNQALHLAPGKSTKGDVATKARNGNLQTVRTKVANLRKST